MRSDDDLLTHVRREAGVRRARRQRALVGAAAVVALALGVAALTATGGGGSQQQVVTDDGDRPGPTAPLDDDGDDPDPTDVVVVPESTTTTTEFAPSTPTTGTVVPETTTTYTEPAPIRPYSMTRVGDGITLTAEALQRRDAPGVVELVVTVRSDHGSAPGGFVTWGEGGAEEAYGAAGPEQVNCAGPRPDPSGAPVEETFRLTRTYAGVGTTVDLSVQAHLSVCFTEQAQVSLTFPVDIGG